MGGGKGMNMNVGHVYGKIVDSISGKPIEYVVVQIIGNKYDTATKALKHGVITGDLSKANGDFSLNEIPVIGNFVIKITALGYKTMEQNFSFNINMGEMMKKSGGQQSGDGNFNFSKMLGAVDKDLGNIKLAPDVKQLNEVVITDDKPLVEIKLDKKIYNVDNMTTTTGGTAEDVLKNIPAVTVDMDGNVNMRNASPQIFVDGRPTTLTIDQIPADAIDKIEVISNPSAKYDASGGMAGIINIVLKKSKRIGYNGSARLSIDQRLRLGGGGDFNVREGKFNFFISLFGNQRRSIAENITTRKNLIGNPLTNLTQTSPSTNNGFFGFGRIGFDYFINNRNTITFSQNIGMGDFNLNDYLNTRVDTVSNNTFSDNTRHSVTDRVFKNSGTSLLYKHIFPKEGRELTSDINFNINRFGMDGNFVTNYYDMSGTEQGQAIKQQQKGYGGSWFLTAQIDYTTPLKNEQRIDFGVRASIKDYDTHNESYIFNPLTNEFMLLNTFGANYIFTDQVYAAYLTYSKEYKKFTYQLGLRAESSIYGGQLLDSNKTYGYTFPVAPFPSAFFTYHISDKSDLQFSYSRKVNRPNFFQLIPATDFSDSLNVRRGNPALQPEFTNSVELNYLKNFNRSNNLMISVYYKYSTNLITGYQFLEYNPLLQRDIVVNTYKNSLYSNSYGAELTSKNSIKKWLDITASANFYYTTINASNIDSGLINERFNWFARLNTTFKLPKNLNLQLTAEYTAKSNLPVSGGGGGGRWGGMGGGMGGGGMWGGNSATAQGYTEPVYVLDAALKWEFMKEKQASLTLNVQDVLKSKINITHTESSFFVQDVSRRRDQLFFRLNFNYRFGKFDVSIFKRKNMKFNTDGMQDMGM